MIIKMFWDVFVFVVNVELGVRLRRRNEWWKAPLDF
jgi:hypothetical protein